MEIEEQPTCDVCGKPATHFARDVIRGTADDGYTAKYEPLHWKAGCKDHPVHSRVVKETL